MSVEAGPSGAVGLSGTAPVALGEFSTIVIDGPLSRGALENTMIIAKFDPVGEIVFKQAEAVAAAAWEKSELIPQQEVVLPVVLPGAEPLVVPQIAPQVEPAPELQVSPAPKTEARVSHQVTPAVLPKPAFLEQEEKEEDILVENRIKEEPEVLEEEEIEEIELKDLLDEKVSEQREHDINKAIDPASKEAEEEGVIGIEGSRIVKFVRLHGGLLSEIAKKLGRDGSLDETIEELATRHFRSKEEAEEQSRAIVSRNEPVKLGREGKQVRKEARLKVLKYELDKGFPSEQVVLRIEKKRKVQVQGQKPMPLLSDVTSEVRETSLADYPELEEVFEKAA